MKKYKIQGNLCPFFFLGVDFFSAFFSSNLFYQIRVLIKFREYVFKLEIRTIIKSSFFMGSGIK